MTMNDIISSTHLISAILALATGGLVLVLKKGTSLHKSLGYLFAITLMVVNISAAFMYNLTGHFNFLHVFMLISFASLLNGLIPAIRRKSKNWYKRHVSGMTAAALGVWAAGFAELTIRLLPKLFSPTMIILIAVGMGILFFFVIGFTIKRTMQNIPEHG